MAKLLHKELTGMIIGVYYDVFNGTSRTYPEYIYERAMMSDLQRKGVACRQQPKYEIFYKDKQVGLQKLDLFVADQVVVEIKVTPTLAKLHKAQAISYLKVTGRKVGLLCNFGGQKPGFERLFFELQTQQSEIDSSATTAIERSAEYVLPELTHTIIGDLYEVHSLLGPGFIYRVYANAVYHELLLRGLEVLPQHEYQVMYRGRTIGEIKFDHLQIANSLMVFPVAIRNIGDLNLINLREWLKIRRIPLGIIANFFPTSLEFSVLKV